MRPLAELIHKHAGRAAFEAYNASRGGLTHDGKPIPTWATLPAGIRQAWIAAALA